LPPKRKAPSPEDDEDDVDAAIEEALEIDDYLNVAKEDKPTIPKSWRNTPISSQTLPQPTTACPPRKRKNSKQE
jgi:hypothetical protein